MTMPFKDEVDKALEMTRREMLEDSGNVWPRLLSFGFGQQLTWAHIDPAYMSDWRSKNLIGAMIVKACFDSRVAVFLSDGYGAMTPPEGKTFEDMPRNFAEWPRSLIREALLIFVNARGMKGCAAILAYTRDGKGRRVFAAAPEELGGHSRFCYDLSDATREAGTLDALLRGRDGGIEQQA